jgi:hypothetical protein
MTPRPVRAGLLLCLCALLPCAPARAEEPASDPLPSKAMAAELAAEMDRIYEEDIRFWDVWHTKWYADFCCLYFTLREEACDGVADCAYPVMRQATSCAGAALAKDPVTTLVRLTPIGTGEYIYDVAVGDDKLTVMGAMAMLPLLRAGKVGRLARGAQLSAKLTQKVGLLAKSLRAKFPRPGALAKGLKYAPSQNIVSPEFVARYAVLMKEGMWKWGKGSIEVTENGVIKDGMHRVLAAQVAGVKIPQEAFKVLPAPGVPFYWDKVTWSLTH